MTALWSLSEGTQQWLTPDYAYLNQSLGGTLRLGVPVAQGCFDNYDRKSLDGNKTACASAQANFLDATYLAAHFGGYPNTNWATCQSSGETCLLNYTMPNGTVVQDTQCDSGNIPSLYVPIRNVEDVQTILKFARENNVPLTVKNSGHDYEGRSSGKGTLAIWTKNLKPPLELFKTFTPAACKASSGQIPR